ncbi:arc6-like protein [Cymbomonas tetramitiformis]|uniref:Arc6-like protein n=1 Tax=Cymbomonas tetramitiformis TaxID=36881 RepID=A0AAE0G6E7_9CHLO|nr:arc6-like protein [Cymbomonas tetramitiformis]
MSAETAKQLVESWQTIKAEALGSKHQASPIASMLPLQPRLASPQRFLRAHLLAWLVLAGNARCTGSPRGSGLWRAGLAPMKATQPAKIKMLDDILEGSMLAQWRARAQDVKQHGWLWEYTLLGLNIDSVKNVEAGKAVVKATLQEAAQLYERGRADDNDAYRSTYCAQYEMTWQAGRGWRISSGAVLY